VTALQGGLVMAKKVEDWNWESETIFTIFMILTIFTTATYLASKEMEIGKNEK